MTDIVERPPYYFMHSTATKGLGTMIWNFAVILQDVRIGVNCSIGSFTEIGRGSHVGDQTRIGAHCFLPPNSKIGRHVFIGPGVVFTDDRFPRIHDPADPPYNAEPPTVGDHANIGAACVILPGVHIGEYANIAAGAVVTKDVPAGYSVMGIPARAFATPIGWGGLKCGGCGKNVDALMNNLCRECDAGTPRMDFGELPPGFVAKALR